MLQGYSIFFLALTMKSVYTLKQCLRPTVLIFLDRKDLAVIDQILPKEYRVVVVN